MWQRPQTLALAGIIVLMLSTLFAPIWSGGLPGGDSYSFDANGVYQSAAVTAENGIGGPVVKMEGNTAYWVYSLCIAAAVIATLSITQFNNRINQMKLGMANSLIMSGLAVYLVVTATNLAKLARVGPEVGNFQIGFWLPFIAMLLNTVANRLIRKDEKLVRSMDRIR